MVKLFSSRKIKKIRKRMNGGAQQFCTECGYKLSTKLGHQFCSQCGTPIKKLCNDCGDTIKYGNNFCVKCGKELNPVIKIRK